MHRCIPIGVDVGKHELHVAFRSRKTWHCWSVKTTDRGGLVKLFEDCRALGAEIVAIERPYLGKNPKVFAELYQAVSAVEFAASDAGLPAVCIYATEWQDGMLLQHGEHSLKRDELKRRSIFRAKAEGVPTESHDTADSVNLCVFAASFDACVRTVHGVSA